METLETQRLRANLVYCYGCRAEHEALLEVRMLHRRMLRNLFFLHAIRQGHECKMETWKCSDGDLENIGKHL